MKMKRLISNGLLILSVFFLGFAIYASSSGESSFLFGFKPFIVTTGSMEPDYPVNALVIIKQVEPEDIEVGDAIAFYSSAVDTYAFHRVVSVAEDGYETKGDNNKFVDQVIVSHDDLLGRAVFSTSILAKILKAPTYYLGISVLMIGSLYMATHFFKQYRKDSQ